MASPYESMTLNPDQLEALAAECEDRAKLFERKAAANRRWAAGYLAVASQRRAA